MNLIQVIYNDGILLQNLVFDMSSMIFLITKRSKSFNFIVRFVDGEVLIALTLEVMPESLEIID